MPLHIQRSGAYLIVVLPPEVLVVKTTDRTAFEEALRVVLGDHAATFEYLKDK